MRNMSEACADGRPVSGRLDGAAVRCLVRDVPAEIDLDLDDPVPVIALLNRHAAGERIDPVEAFEALEPIESVVIGDVEACRKKMERYAAAGVDRLMCLMQMGRVPHDVVMESIRITGEELVPKLAG